MKQFLYIDSFPLPTIGKRLALITAAVLLYYLAAGEIIRRYNVQLSVNGTAASLISTVILSLLMGFRNRAAFDRWWSARGLWGQLVNDSRNLAAKLAALVPLDVLSAARTGELLAGFAEALKCHLRDQSPRLNELPGFENEKDDPAHVPLYLARRLYASLAEWKRAGRIDGSELWLLDVHARGLMDVCGACEKIRHTPLPPSYKALLRTGLMINVLAEPWLALPETRILGLLAYALVCFFLLGTELIDSVVEEPFGHQRDDLDLDRYCRTIREGVRASIPNSENN